MGKFIRRTLKVTSPFLIFYFMTFLFFIYTGEIGQNRFFFQSSKNTTFQRLGLAYCENDRFYKSWGTMVNNPDIIALGSSRDLEIRKEFFNKAKFFNTGRTIEMPQDLNVFFGLHKDKLKDKLIIVGIDQWWFNKDYFKKTTPAKRNDFLESKIDLDYCFNMAKPFIESLFKTQLDFAQIFTSNKNHRIGINAILQNKGFRVDGSYSYGDENTVMGKYPNFNDVYERLDKGFKRLDFGNDVDKSAINGMYKFLKSCKENNTTVIGFLPPFPNTVWQRIIKGGNHQYMSKIAPTLKPVFSQFGFVFADYSNPKTVQIVDRESIDGLHCTEKAYLKIILQLCEKSPLLKQSTDVKFLKRKLSATEGFYEVFQ